MHHSGLRERKKQTTRAAIADAALRLFAERGYEETTIADIAAAAVVAPRTFFSYFPSKEEVVFAEVDDRLAEVWARLDERPPAGEPPLVTLRRVGTEVLEAMLLQDSVYSRVRLELILGRPSLQARGMQRLLDAELELARRLTKIVPGLGEPDAVIISASVVGGMRAALVYVQQQGMDAAGGRAMIDRAFRLLENGVAILEPFQCLSAP